MTVLLKIFGMMLIIAALASFALMAVAGVALEMARRSQDGLFGDGYRPRRKGVEDGLTCPDCERVMMRVIMRRAAVARMGKPAQKVWKCPRCGLILPRIGPLKDR